MLFNVLAATLNATPNVSVEAPKTFEETFIDFPIVTKERLEYTQEYANMHYGMDTYYLTEPKMVVLHYTGITTLLLSLRSFKQAEIPDFRERLAGFGKVNVGVHFVVDRNGDIYKLLPTNIMGRHVVGFNHVSIGIENVADYADHLSPEQVKANVKLVAYLKEKHPSIEHMIGHIEYMHIKAPHFKYHKELIKEYEPPIKIDPGWEFMKAVRRLLYRDHQITLKK